MSEQRIENLETIVRALREEVRELRSEMARLNGAAAGLGSAPRSREDAAPPIGKPGPLARPSTGGAPPNSQATAPPPPIRHRSPARRLAWSPWDGGSAGVEAWIGRYGMLAIAALLVVMGIGAFVTWAAANMILGPVTRVVLGALAALALAAIGLRLAARGTVTFGHTLLALALAVAHVDAWAAGPVLGLVPSFLALGAAALASIALAALALRERREILFAVGLGGALLAPFVTGDQQSSVILLLSYGWVVLASAMAVSRSAEWRLTHALLGIGAVIYVIAALSGDQVGLASATTIASFPLACAWAAYLWGGARLRLGMSLAFLALGALAMLALVGRAATGDLIPAAVVAVVSSGVFLETRSVPRKAAAIGAAVLPVAFLLAALGFVEYDAGKGALLAAAWTIAALALVRFSRAHQEHYATAAGFTALIGIIVGLRDYPAACVAAVAVVGLASSYSALRADGELPLLPAVAAFVIAVVWSQLLFAARGGFVRVPFVSSESAAALSVVASAAGASYLFHRVAHPMRRLVQIIVAGSLFFWIRAELKGAFNADLATFLLILFYAAFGIALIAHGRRHALAPARGAGMLLALFAAGKAVTEASSLTTIGLRIGSYLLVGAFLLAVAYWYRAAVADPNAHAPT